MQIKYYDDFAKRLSKSYATTVNTVLRSPATQAFTNDEAFYHRTMGEALLNGKTILLQLVHDSVTLPSSPMKVPYFLYSKDYKLDVDYNPRTMEAIVRYIRCS